MSDLLHPLPPFPDSDVRSTLPGLVWSFTPDRRRCLFVNKYGLQLLGYPVEVVELEDFWANHVHPDDCARSAPPAGSAGPSASPRQLDYRVRTCRGHFIWIRESVQLTRAVDGAPMLFGVALEISDRIGEIGALVARIEQGEAAQHGADEARRIHHRFERAFAQINASIDQLESVDGLEGPFLSTVSALFGARAFWASPEQPQPANALTVTVLPPGAPPRVLGVVDERAPRQWTADDRQLLDAIRQRVTDVLANFSAQQSALESQRRFQVLLDHSMDAFFMHDWDGTVLEVNQVACEMLGRTREELVGSSPTTFDPTLTREQLIDILKGLDIGQTIGVESVHQHKDGRRFPVEVRLRPFWTNGRRNAVATVRDLTEQQQRERERVESHNLLQSIVEGTTDSVFVKDLDGRYRLINSAGAAFLNRPVEAIIGRTDAELIGAESAAAIAAGDRQVLTTGHVETVEERVVQESGTRTFMAVKSPRRDADGRIIGLIGVSRDITETRRLEEQFRQAQKMESVGRLAGGIAHDFNNLLTVINSGTELVLDQVAPEWPMRKLLAEVLKAGTRAANLTGQLLSFSRKQMLQPRPVRLTDALTELMNLLRRLLREDIELSLRLEDDTAVAVVDRSQFEQAIINLAVNARDAMPTGGRLVIGTRREVIAAVRQVSEGELAAGHYVVVWVTDTGTGMDESTRRQVFEPFFTTKGPGGGTGLGLAMVYGFVKQSGGHVEVTSSPGEGTTFRMYFPRQADDPARLQPQASTAPANGVARAETVLIVESENAVRRLAAQVLRSKGYTVLDARNGAEAFEVTRQAGYRLDLVITELTVADMDGRELVGRLSREHLSLRVLFMSGYSDEAAIVSAVHQHQVGFLPKPFSPGALVMKVRELLDRHDRRRHELGSRAKMDAHVDSSEPGA